MRLQIAEAFAGDSLKKINCKSNKILNFETLMYFSVASKPATWLFLIHGMQQNAMPCVILCFCRTVKIM